MKWSIKWEKPAAKELEDLPESIRFRIAQAVTALGNNPLPPGVKKLKTSRFTIFRIRVGDYRVFYTLESEHGNVVITAVGHRREIYRGLDRK
jgi:mRNA interferase RelE/StbE